MLTPTAYGELAETLSRIGHPGAAAEYHGTLCGALSVLPPEQIDLLSLIEAGAREPLAADAQARPWLERFRHEVLVALQDEQMGFNLLLPDDDAELGQRVQALADWCEGFLYGLASRPGLDLSQVSEDARDILRDFSEFTRASLGDDEDAELEETAYTELVEYVRVAAQLVFMELRPRPIPDPSASQQVH
jgi:uncharacterized protein